MANASVDRWVALRALYEGAPATAERLAAAGGCSQKFLEAKAAAEGWKAADADDAAGREERLQKMLDRMIGELEAIGEADGEGAVGFDKARIEAVSALTRTLEKIGEITRSTGDAKENRASSHADMAEALRVIDRRIVELAAGLGGAEHPACAGDAGDGGVVSDRPA